MVSRGKKKGRNKERTKGRRKEKEKMGGLEEFPIFYFLDHQRTYISQASRQRWSFSELAPVQQPLEVHMRLVLFMYSRGTLEKYVDSRTSVTRPRSVIP
ncbi:hypothetical protein Y032_0075g986 [Ancylostoma ceylanicum]|uniref:Uncharacterized protein n=1 Tax=Ancylostoma ceylanicum TaxID=53326 RepID=A0A016TUD4_9BILA|nr:hypothetical protein Y032_0075g986 [Ancylostoma ceylanicum]